MKTAVWTIGFVICWTLCGRAAGVVFAQGAAPVTLTNRALELEIRPSPAPHVARLVHRASGTAVVAAPEHRSLFSIGLAKSGGGLEWIESAAAKQSTLRAENQSGGSRVIMTWSGFPAGELSVTATAVCRPAEPLTFWSIRLHNGTGRAVASVRYPMVMAVPRIGDPADDFVVAPYLPGAMIVWPDKNWPKWYSMPLTYPGSLSAQFIAYQDRTAGVYLAGQDGVGHPHALAISKRPAGYLLHHEYVLSADAKPDWEGPYAVALGVAQGTWCDSADQYKAWAVRQPWCAKTLAQRDDVPQWWKQGPNVHVCEVHTYDSHRVSTGSFYSQLLGYLRNLREKIDGPVVCMLGGWENHRRWTAGDYFPVFDQDNARRTIAAMRSEGFRPFFFLSGLFYTFLNEGVDGSAIPTPPQLLGSFVIDKKTGKPGEFALNESSPGGTWKRRSYEFCVAGPQTKQFFRQVIDRAHELGVDVLQMDQTTHGAGDVCYSTGHGHAPGEGLYTIRAFVDLLTDMRSYGKGKTPDFVLFHEEPHEQLIQCLDGFHVREYKEKEWYRSSPGAIGIPLFSYLYHEYAIGYGGDSCGLSKNDDRWLVRSHAVNMVTGRTPGNSVWSSHQNTLAAHGDQIAMIRNHCRLLNNGGQKYLMLGRMLHPYELNVPKATYKLWGRGKPQEFDEPVVLTSSWQSPDGAIGHLLVNVGRSKQAVSLDLDARNASMPGRCDLDLWTSQGDAKFAPLARGATLPHKWDRDLAPGEVVFVEIRSTTGR